MRIAILAVTVATAAACTNLQPQRPTVAVAKITIPSVSLSAPSAVLTARVTNPNGFAIPLRAVQWQLSVAGARAMSGQVRASTTIEANSSSDVRIDLGLRMHDGLAVANALASGDRSYRISGVMHFDTRLGSLRVRFEANGELGR